RPGAQTERRGGAGLGRDLLGGGTSPALQFFRTKAAFHGLRFICVLSASVQNLTTPPSPRYSGRAGAGEPATPSARGKAATAYFPFPSSSATSFWKSARGRRGARWGSFFMCTTSL